MRHRWSPIAAGFATACCVLTLVALTGYAPAGPGRQEGGSTLSVTPLAVARSLPAEPMQVSGDLAPCALLTSAQVHQLGLNPGAQQPAGDARGGPSCVWKTFVAARWGGEYLARLLHGPTPGGTPAASINNLPTVEYRPPNLDPGAYCVYLVTVAPGTTLWAQYGGPNQSGITHVIACRNAQAAASDMSGTFRSLSS
ncbi:MAG: hypothetical protein QOF38_3825 [Pseudonocardiales bacterium]|jgi:hypothetical protein|nr:hypothetical protein [Pseudonocardiales bacterium]MDT7680610.1 hypothetical protein [Pseudonocardiales bacterium]